MTGGPGRSSEGIGTHGLHAMEHTAWERAFPYVGTGRWFSLRGEDEVLCTVL